MSDALKVNKKLSTLTDAELKKTNDVGLDNNDLINDFEEKLMLWEKEVRKGVDIISNYNCFQ